MKKKAGIPLQKRIKELRKSLGLSQREFGENLGISRNVVSNLEYGRVAPKALMIRHICQQYGVRKSWLLTGEGEMFEAVPQPVRELANRSFQKLKPEFQHYIFQQIDQLLSLQEKLEQEKC